MKNLIIAATLTLTSSAVFAGNIYVDATGGYGSAAGNNVQDSNLGNGDKISDNGGSISLGAGYEFDSGVKLGVEYADANLGFAKQPSLSAVLGYNLDITDSVYLTTSGKYGRAKTELNEGASLTPIKNGFSGVGAGGSSEHDKVGFELGAGYKITKNFVLEGGYMASGSNGVGFNSLTAVSSDPAVALIPGTGSLDLREHGAFLRAKYRF